MRVNGQVVRRGDVTVADGDRVDLGEPPPEPFPTGLRKIYEDDDLVVIDKPKGLLTIATESERERTAYRMLAGYVERQSTRGRAPRRLFIVHRLDRETSGVLAFAKSGAAKRALQEQFEARSAERRYIAVVEGRVKNAEGTLRSRLTVNRDLRVRPTRRRTEGKEAITHYRVVKQGKETTVLELSLTTGRRGQIRAQLAALGHPIVGDDAYGSTKDPLRRVCLHATKLALLSPSGRRLTFESPPPPSFDSLP